MRKKRSDAKRQIHEMVQKAETRLKGAADAARKKVAATKSAAVKKLDKLQSAASRKAKAAVRAVESEAATLPEVIQETLLTRTSERQGRAIDKDAGGAGMEVKKRQGYF